MYDENTTVLCVTSTRPSHPSTEIIDQTLESVRHWFPHSLIKILCDGIRPEFEHRREAYLQHLDNLADKWSGRGCEIIQHTWHAHQSTMIKNVLPTITTPLVLFIEDDLPMMMDRDIEWPMIESALLTGSARCVRLMLTETVHDLHQYLYFGPLDGYPYLLKQKQLSGWTHLATTEYYRQLLANFDTRAKCTVERYATRLVDPAPWERWKLTSYVPDPQCAKRIVHLDGRAHPSGDWNLRDDNYESQEVYPPR